MASDFSVAGSHKGVIGNALKSVGLSGGKVGLIALAGVALAAVGLGIKSLFNGSKN